MKGVVPGVVLAVLVALAGTVQWTGLPGAVGLVVVSVVWLRVNGPVEGRVLWVVTSRRGLTAADLAGLVGVVLGVVHLVW